MNSINSNIQALRGICAVVVFMSHAMHVYNSQIIEFLDCTPFRLLYSGEVAVSIFFVLSGFFYYKEKTLTVSGYVNSIIKKIKRIYPAHVLFLTIGFILLTLYQRYNINNDVNVSVWFQEFWKKPVSIVEYLKGCTVLLPYDANLINPPVWYLEPEVKMFIIMPLLIFVLNKKGWWLSIPIVLLCTIGRIPVVNCVGYYLLGALARKYNESFYYSLCKSHIGLFVCLFVSIVLLNIEHEIQVNNSYTNMISCVGACILIIILFNTNIDFFKKSIFKFFGTISYEFYLCHFVVLLGLKPFISGVSLIIVSFFISLFFAFVTSNLTSKIFVEHEFKKDN